MKWEHKS